MRLYSFVNSYLSPLQQGLQTAHLVGEFSHKISTDQALTYVTWAEDYKTIIILNGGNCASLNELITQFQTPENQYPWGYFFEDRESLNGALTCVGIILPERIYEGARIYRENRMSKITEDGVWGISYDLQEVCLYTAEYSEFDLELIKIINSCRLA